MKHSSKRGRSSRTGGSSGPSGRRSSSPRHAGPPSNFTIEPLSRFGQQQRPAGKRRGHRPARPHEQAQQQPRRDHRAHTARAPSPAGGPNLDPFELFCAYYLGITTEKHYRPANIHDVARRFNVESGVIRQVLQANGMDADTMLNIDFDLTMAQIDIQVAPEGVDRVELARALYDEFTHAPRKTRSLMARPLSRKRWLSARASCWSTDKAESPSRSRSDAAMRRSVSAAILSIFPLKTGWCASTVKRDRRTSVNCASMCLGVP